MRLIEHYIYLMTATVFLTLACALAKQYSPIIQHDNAVIRQKLETSLCNFHGLAAYREHLQQDPVLKQILEPLLAGFKAVMRVWCPFVIDYLIAGYLSFISAINPKIVPEDIKCKLLSYLQQQWFTAPWKETMSAAIPFLFQPNSDQILLCKPTISLNVNLGK